jgi:hypothetical protein
MGIFENAQILCFVLKICHNFKSYQTMLTFSNLVFCIIRYNFSLSNIYIVSHLHAINDLWIFLNLNFW